MRAKRMQVERGIPDSIDYSDSTDDRMPDIRDTEGACSVFIATDLSVSLTVSDLDASVAWYRDALGFQVERRFEREGKAFATRMSAGAVLLLLTQDNGARGTSRVKGEGLSLRFTTTQDIDAIAERIQARGHSLEAPPFDAFGMRAFRVRDPDGFLLVISSEAPDNRTRQ